MLHVGGYRHYINSYIIIIIKGNISVSDLQIGDFFPEENAITTWGYLCLFFICFSFLKGIPPEVIMQ